MAIVEETTCVCAPPPPPVTPVVPFSPSDLLLLIRMYYNERIPIGFWSGRHMVMRKEFERTEEGRCLKKNSGPDTVTVPGSFLHGAEGTAPSRPSHLWQHCKHHSERSKDGRLRRNRRRRKTPWPIPSPPGRNRLRPPWGDRRRSRHKSKYPGNGKLRGTPLFIELSP